MNRWLCSPSGALAIVLALVVATTDAADNPGSIPRATVRAADVARRFLPLHPRPRNDAEKQIIAVMDEILAAKSPGVGIVPPEDGRMLRLLAESLHARHVVELGTGSGYSSLWFCLALRSTGGRLTTHELDSQRAAEARERFRRAGVEGLVTVVEGDAHQTVRRLTGPLDLVLLDAEKEGFVDYLKVLLPLVRSGGLVIAHDSTGQADQMHDYFRAVAAEESLETVLIDASPWGMAISRKMQ